ncbi:MAG: helix-turn-helix domain-containing protein [Lachnospiraceae bacterium]|nr:helix-turn-helix domain-containing protein [Lachnospiraceae bacterium]
MLNENIKKLRKEKGMSQEELAEKLNVVRQTVSKWEQNLSVPDSEMLIKIADVFDVSVGSLLGETVEVDNTKSELAEISQKLENLNAMMAERNSRSRRIWLTVIAVSLILIASFFLFTNIYTLLFMISPSQDVAIIGGADGPTQIFVASTSFDWVTPVLLFLAPVILIVISVYLLKKAKR